MRNTGPCLCGDPYCGSCGNPEAMAFADAVDFALETLSELIETDNDLELLNIFISMVKRLKEKERKERTNHGL